MSNENPYPLALSIGAQTRMTQRLFAADLQAALAPHDIPVGMWYFLRVLWEQDGLTQREICDRAGATAPTSVEQLRNMATRGLITRKPSDTDRRKLHFHLTDAGRALEHQLIGYARDVNEAALEGLSLGEIGFLRLALLRIQDNLARREKARLAQPDPSQTQARSRDAKAAAVADEISAATPTPR